MTAPRQGRTEQTIEASPARIWSILEDSSRLPEWVPLVKEVTSHESRESTGTVRRCNVQFGSKQGYMVERCVEAVPERKLVHAVDDDSLGFTKMFADYTFTLELEPEGADRTRVTCEAFYEPRGPLGKVVNAVLMRRKFAGARKQILSGLKRAAESRT